MESCESGAQTRMKALVVDDSSKRLVLGDAPVPALRSREVLIRVAVSGVNRADLMQAAGRYPPPAGASPIIGLEVSGVVQQVDKDCQLGFKQGDEVMALLPGGGYAELVAVHEATVMPLPKIQHSDFSKWEIGAAIPEAFLTAFQILFWIGQPQLPAEALPPDSPEAKEAPERGDVVLIHAGASGVGTTLVQYCKAHGLRAFVTAGSDEKIRRCLELGAEGGAVYKTEDFAERLLEQFPEGADVILDCVGQAHFASNVRAVARDGRWVSYGLLSGAKVPLPDGEDKFDMAFFLRKRVTLSGTTLRTRSMRYKERLVRDFVRRIEPLIEKGAVRPIISKVFPAAEGQAAHDMVRANANVGKVLISWEEKT